MLFKDSLKAVAAITFWIYFATFDIFWSNSSGKRSGKLTMNTKTLSNHWALAFNYQNAGLCH